MRMSAMVIRSWIRAFEKRCLRPLGRLLPAGRRSPAGDQLERRIAELETLVRELAGMVSLALDERATRRARGDAGEPEPSGDRSREAV
jgi:hypothetical protein